MTEREILEWIDYLSAQGRFVFGPAGEVPDLCGCSARSGPRRKVGPAVAEDPDALSLPVDGVRVKPCTRPPRVVR